MINKKKNKECKKYKNFNKQDVIVKSPNVSKCIANVLIYKFSAIKIVTVVDVVIKNQMINIKKQFLMH